MTTARDILLQGLESRLEPPVLEWLRAQCAQLEAGAPDRVLHLAFGQAARKAGHAALNPSGAERAAAAAHHPGWDLREWTVDLAARAALLLSLPDSAKTNAAVLGLFQTADLREHVALARTLFLMPGAAALLHIAREAIRSNMGDVFRAISQGNPYAAEHFDEIAWNQMVAKCVFTDVPLRTVYGLDARVNEALARMLLDLARERRAAGRALSPEAWRCVAPFAGFERGDEVLEFLDAALAKPAAPGAPDPERRGAALALRAMAGERAAALLASRAPELAAAVSTGSLTWDNYDA
jgi:hypothetical protein